MKTLEFKLNLNKTQEALANKWLDDLRWVWNKGLSLLEEEQQRYWRANGCKASEYPPIDDGNVTWKIEANPIYKMGGVSYTKTALEYAVAQKLIENPLKEPKPSSFVSGLSCPFLFDQDERKLVSKPKLREHYDRTANDKGKVFTSNYYKEENAPDWMTVPSRFKTAVFKDLTESWKNYKNPKHKGRKPRYKKKTDKIISLANTSAGGRSGERWGELKPVESVADGKFGNGTVLFPKLGRVKTKGLFRRYNFKSEIVYCDDKGNLFEKPKFENNWGESRIVKEGSNYYLQVVVSTATRLKPPKYPDDAIGLDPGVVHAVNRSDGWTAKNHRYYRKAEKRLTRLGRKASRQQDGSKNQKKTYIRTADLHAKVKRARRANNHKISTTLVQTFGGISIEENKFSNMTRRPKPKKRTDGNGWEQNKAAQKSGLNKSLLDVGGYQLRNMIEAKTKQHCEFHAVDAPNNSRTCAQCGVIDEKSRQSQSVFICTACQHSENADTNAAQVNLMKAPWSREFRFRMREPVAVQASQKKDTPVSRGNRRGRKPDSTKPAFVRSDGRQQQELAATEARSAQAGIPEITGKSLRGKSGNLTTQSRKKRSAQLHAEIHMQLSLWDAAGEVNSNTS